MSEQELIDYIQARLTGSSSGQLIDTGAWLDELVAVFPDIPRERLAERLRREARRVGVSMI